MVADSAFQSHSRPASSLFATTKHGCPIWELSFYPSFCGVDKDRFSATENRPRRVPKPVRHRHCLPLESAHLGSSSWLFLENHDEAVLLYNLSMNKPFGLGDKARDLATWARHSGDTHI